MLVTTEDEGRRMRYIRNESILAQRIDENVVLLSADQADLLTLNAPGAAIWDALAHPGSLDDVVDRVAADWPGVDAAVLRADATTYLEQLTTLGVVRGEG